MRWDLGFAGLTVLAGMSLVFGMVAHLIIGRTAMRWVWLIAAGAYFIAGLLVSEVWFGWATGEELQPNIDGLSFDEVNLVTLFGIIAAVVLRYLLRRKGPSSGAPGDVHKRPRQGI
ncbi:hypothetical protein [Arthrobacter silvisoli]|uniref:hypothetical protein n=1 Tax=Arthrobacter silvisoli TaxID=2291022 RepID=UPI000E212273|nr:hypothetical protein [Arthrobacter silvisoli]